MLDDTPITVTLPASLLGHTLGAVRSQLKRRDRSLAKGEFIPAPGRLNLNKIKADKLRAAEASLDAALREHLASSVRGD